MQPLPLSKIGKTAKMEKEDEETKSIIIRIVINRKHDKIIGKKVIHTPQSIKRRSPTYLTDQTVSTKT